MFDFEHIEIFRKERGFPYIPLDSNIFRSKMEKPKMDKISYYSYKRENSIITIRLHYLDDEIKLNKCMSSSKTQQ